MRITYQLSYNALFMLKDGKRPVSRAIQEASEVDVPEVSSDDAPIAAHWMEGTERDPDGRKAFHVRTYEGECYETCFQAMNEAGDIRSVVRRLSDADAKPGKVPAEEEIAHRLSDNRLDVYRVKQERLGKLLLVDGAPYIGCAKPSLELGIKDMARLRVIRRPVMPASTQYGHGIDQTLVAPLTSFQAVSRRGEALPVRFVQGVFDVEVLIPEAIMFDTKAEAIMRTIGQAIADNEVTLHTMPREAAEEFIAIRSEYRGWYEEPDSTDIASLLDRTYSLMTSHYGLYNQAYVASFLSNYERAQEYASALDVSVNPTSSRTIKASP